MRLILEFDPRAQPVTGVVTDVDGVRHPFAGFLELFSLIGVLGADGETQGETEGRAQQ